jgi:pantothenate kinase type III
MLLLIDAGNTRIKWALAASPAHPAPGWPAAP